MRNIFCCILFFIVISLTYGQKPVKAANEAFKKNEYVEAIGLYIKALSKVNNREILQELYLHCGDCYFYLKEYDKALNFYEKSLKAGYFQPYIFYQMGTVLLMKGEYDEAKVYIDLYLEKNPEDEKGKNMFKSYRYAVRYRDSIPDLEITNEKGLNTPYAEYGPAMFNNSLIFSSSRIIKDSTSIYSVTGQAFNDFYESRFDTVNGMWKNPLKISGSINTPYNEGSCIYNNESNTLYLMICNGISGNKKTCNIYYSIPNKLNNTWSEPIMLNLGSEEYNQGHPAISTDGKTLYFVSDMPNGEGGKDIWYVEKKGDEKWSEPINAGKKVNTIGDEMFPFVYKDSILYFSSDGLPGYGGLDIFYTTISESGPGIPENAGLPINSCADDFGIVVFRQDSGLLCSNRPGGAGDDDIYSFYRKQEFFTIEGIIKDKVKKRPISNALVLLNSYDSDFDSTRTDTSGTYKFNNVKTGQDYALTVHKNGYLGELKYVEPKSSVERNMNDNISKMKINMISMTDGEIKINNIYYDFGRWTITEESRKELDHLSDILKINPDIRIKINSHTDDIGDEEFNLELSNYRAQSVVNYLIKKGIAQERLSYKGWGETQPIVKNAKTEDERKLNRRTTFQIVNLNDIDLSYSPAEYKKLAEKIILDKKSKKEYLNESEEEKKEIVFRLQIYAGNKKISRSYRNDIEQIIGRYEIILSKGQDGYYRYAIGDFKKFDQVIAMRDTLKANNYDSFVIAFMNNLRISILEARQLSEKYSNY